MCVISSSKRQMMADSGCQQSADSRATFSPFSSSGTGGGQGDHSTLCTEAKFINVQFLDIIWRVLGLEVSGTMLHYKPVSSHFCSSGGVGGGGG